MGAYRNDVASDNPYWHYEFNNDYTDSEGVAPTGGANFGGSTFASFSSGGIPDTSSHYLDFSGSVDSGKYLSSTSNAALSSDLDDNDLQTLELWYTPTAIRTSGTCNLIRMDGTRWWMRTDNGYVSAQINTDHNGGTQYYFADNTTQLQNNTEYHLVWTWDGDKIRIYINGDLKATSSSIPGSLAYTSMSQCYVGSPGGESANGYIDEIAMYRSALGLTEIQSHYTSGGGTLPNVTVNATVTDIDIAANDATVDTFTDVTVNAEVTNIHIAGQAATVTAIGNADVTTVVTDIDITGKAATIITDSSTQIAVTSTDIDITGHAATVTATADVTVNAVVTDIAITGADVTNLYPSLVLADNPTHYWKFNLQGTEYVIKDYGSSVKDGQIVNRANNGSTLTYLDNANFVNGINSDFGSNAILLEGVSTGAAASSSFERVEFTGDQPTIIGDNLTYELWFKTTSSYNELLVFDSPIYEPSASFDVRNTCLGLIAGKLSTWQQAGSQTDWDSRTNVVTYDYEVNDGNWHHLMMTKSTSGGVSTYKSYLDGSQTATTLSLGNLLTHAVKTTAYDFFTGAYTVDETDTNLFVGYGYHDSDYYGGTNSSYSLYIDDIAIYETALVQQDAIDRYGAGAGSESVTVTVTGTDIDIAGTGPTKPVIINVSKTNINAKGKVPQITAGGFVTIGHSAPNVAVTGVAPTLVIDGSVSIGVTRTTVSISGENVFSGTKDVELRFIPISDQSISAFDAEEITSLNYGGLLYNTTKTLAFKIGNEASEVCTFNVRIGSINADILPGVQISYDGHTFVDSLTIEGIRANTTTEAIFVRLDVNQIPYIGRGTFVLDVEQTLYA